MYLLILTIPLLSAIISGFCGRKLGENGVTLLTTSLIGITSMLSWFAFYEVALNGAPAYLPNLFVLIDSGLFSLSFGLLYDSLTVSMLILVTTVSALVHLYSTGYIKGDPHLPRFMSYLSLFTFFMIILVTADNFLQLFIGWEGVGVCSYLLINFWYTRIQANKSAMKAMIVNRIGDIGLALGMLGIWYVYRTLEYASLFSIVGGGAEGTIIILGQEVEALTLIGILLFIGAVGKSAQLGLHTWLPDAMEGPTPVSALIHAATMVTAGVFLLIRTSCLLEFAPVSLMVIVIVGALTAFFAGSVGLFQNDIKKVIAYSTCSQLGYMVFACGLSCYSASLFHLINHGFFKALLFLSAGSVIHAMADEQDMRKLGGLVKVIPFTYVMMLIGSLSLMGAPFLTGFYSKDAILEFAFSKYSIDGSFAHWLGIVSAFFTSFYSFRLLYLSFISSPNASQAVSSHAHESSPNMSIPLIVLAFGSIFAGYLLKDMFIGMGSDFLANSVYEPGARASFDAEFITHIKPYPVIFSISGAIFALLLYHLFPSSLFVPLVFSSWGAKIYTFFNNKWHWDAVYAGYLVPSFMNFGYQVSYKILDRGLIEKLGPHGLTYSLVRVFSLFISSLQTGAVGNYALTLLIGLLGGIQLLGVEWNDPFIVALVPVILSTVWKFKP